MASELADELKIILIEALPNVLSMPSREPIQDLALVHAGHLHTLPACPRFSAVLLMLILRLALLSYLLGLLMSAHDNISTCNVDFERPRDDFAFQSEKE